MKNLTAVRNATMNWWLGLTSLAITTITSLTFFLVGVILLVTGVGLIPSFGIGFILLVMTHYLLRWFRAVSRNIAASGYNLTITAAPRRVSNKTGLNKFIHQIWLDTSDAAMWRGIAYEGVMVPVSFVGLFAGTGLIGGGVGLIWHSAADTNISHNLALLGPVAPPWRLLIALGAIVLGIVIVWAANLTQRTLAASLLGTSKKEALRTQVATLSTARQGAVAAAEAERQRIERDLHDGAQPQLVALAMTLGLAKTKIHSDPDAAALLIDEAHQQAKQAVTDLRQLARGIHPAVLTDRGLDAALSAIAARSTVPVNLSVVLTERAHPEAEAAAYFLVAEALTNVAKHSDATACTINVTDHAGMLLVQISDDGRGGATTTPGGIGTSGLQGLTDRITATGGHLNISSPPGGPTLLRAEIPLNPLKVSS